jgi:aryl-alcohol dehydrogenase-like predicted oxidoreductase
MRYENIRDLSIPKIGFGTWTIGGEGSPDPTRDKRSLDALGSALELGYTHFDTAEGYAAGHLTCSLLAFFAFFSSKNKVFRTLTVLSGMG